MENVDKIKRELSENGVLVEDYGGQVQSCEISAMMPSGPRSPLRRISPAPWSRRQSFSVRSLAVTTMTWISPRWNPAMKPGSSWWSR